MKKFDFEIHGSAYRVDIKSFEGEIAELEVNGTPYSVKVNIAKEEVKKTAPRPVTNKVTVPSPAASSSIKKIKSPLPGNIFKINVAAGNAFKEGDVLMIMESMKMENNILAENNGTITKVCVSAGQAVLQDEALFEYQ
jgi:biotin carboxyl carrier protein